MAMYQEFYYPSCGPCQIHACRWSPEGTPKAVVQIVHCVAEYAARYDHFASWLASRGFLVVAEDHMGHGLSVSSKCPQGDFAGQWFQAVADSHELFCQTRQAYPQLPYILLGHSMGSFMVRTILARYPESSLSAAIISGTAWMGDGMLRMGKAASGFWGTLFGRHKPSTALTGMIFGGYNRKFKPARTPSDWLSRDEMQVDAYVADPLCGFPVTPALLKEMMTGLQYIQQPEHLQRMNKQLPVLFVSGQEDPVGDAGEGVRRAHRAFEEAGMQQATLRLYPDCRHELLNERNRDQVYADLLTWMDQLGLYD